MAHGPLATELRRLVRPFLRFRKAQSVAASTLSGNEHHLRRFIGWVETEKPKLRSLVEIDREVLDDYALWLAVYESEEGHRLMAVSRHNHLTAVGTFFRWLERTRRILTNPAEDLALPKVPEKLPRGVLTPGEVRRVLAVPDLDRPTGLRARAILEVLYSTGVRNAELRALKLQNLNFAEGLLTVRQGKGSKDRVVPLGAVAADYVKRYLAEVRPLLRRSRFEEHLFLSRFGRPLSKTQLILLMETIGKKAGLGKPLTCHGLRHSCATHMLQGRADVRHIQELLGHRTLTATQVYTHVAASDLKRVHARCHPRERRP